MKSFVAVVSLFWSLFSVVCNIVIHMAEAMCSGCVTGEESVWWYSLASVSFLVIYSNLADLVYTLGACNLLSSSNLI